ncbi:probable serine hydrolase [Cloeon dipterum]|uniref:probable serine hydrolase n=1 Tax=Cloeon dipterum TaxID=197152 RepID=UPI00322020FB
MRSQVRNVLQRAYSSVAPKYEEVRFPVPWGHIAGKWWGPQDRQPVIAMHGWQENSNSFDPLMKILPPDVSVLTLDMPGNGLSSRFPTYGTYHLTEDLSALRAVLLHLKYKKPIRFLCHSYSSGVATTYSASYPTEVERALFIDMVKPYAMNPKTLANHGGQALDKLIDFQLNESKKEATLEEHAAQYRKALMKSMSMESAKLLMERATVFNPATGLYIANRDPRIKIEFYYSFPNEFLYEIIKKIKCKVLIVMGSKGLIFESPKIIKVAKDLMEKSTDVEYVEVDGTHHVHMDKPHLVAPYVLRFLFDRKVDN